MVGRSSLTARRIVEPEGGRVQPGAEPAGEVDQLAEEPLGVAVGGQGVGEVVRRLLFTDAGDQPDAEAGDAPGQRR